MLVITRGQCGVVTCRPLFIFSLLFVVGVYHCGCASPRGGVWGQLKESHFLHLPSCGLGSSNSGHRAGTEIPSATGSSGCASLFSKPEEGARSPGSGVTDAGEPLVGCWEQNPAFSREQQVFFTTEPSLQSLPRTFEPVPHEQMSSKICPPCSPCHWDYMCARDSGSGRYTFVASTLLTGPSPWPLL